MSIRSTESIQIEFDDNSILSSLFGVNDANIRTLEKINEVKIEYRGNKVKIVGHKFSIEETRRELENLFEEAKKGIEIDEEKIKEKLILKQIKPKKICQILAKEKALSNTKKFPDYLSIGVDTCLIFKNKFFGRVDCFINVKSDQSISFNSLGDKYK